MKDMEKTLPPSESGLILHNRLPERHPYRPHLEEALRTALNDLPGSWDVSIIPVGRRQFNIEVLAPDASRWSAAVPVPEGPRAEDVADVVRAACARRCPVKPVSAPTTTEPSHSFSPAKASAPHGGALLEPVRYGPRNPLR
jgi:hypothetical protein